MFTHKLYDLRDRMGLHTNATQDPTTHLDAAIRWIYMAHDAIDDGGVSHSYDIRKKQWLASYPETTGYIIPTLFDYYSLTGEEQAKDRAITMTRWECDEQFTDGGVRAGTMDAETVVPTIFNTGQVIFGFARAAVETQDALIRASLVRASDWLVQALDDDGCWRKFPSPFTSTNVAAYNVRNSFALMRAHEVTGNDAYRDAAQSNVSWTCDQANDHDWIPGNSLDHEADDSALTHTLAYSIRGLLEAGALLNDDKAVGLATRMSEKIANAQRADGALPGMLSPDWQSKSSWSCVTGNSQMAIIWLRLAQISGKEKFRQHAVKANRFNMSIQPMAGRRAETIGAMPGSFPLSGEYMTWRFPNWATKFFADALILELNFETMTRVGG